MQQSSFLQTKAWADFKAAHGWQTHWIDSIILVLERQLPGNVCMLYVPEVILPSESQEFIKSLIRLAKSRRCTFIRLEPLVTENDPESQLVKDLLQKNNFAPSFEDVQPSWRQWIDLRVTPDQQLAQMRPKGRYNIKVAQKHGVKIIHQTGDQPSVGSLVSRVHRLYRQTATRDGFSPRDEQYFIDLTKQLGKQAHILLASYEGIDVAGMILVIHEHIASYLYGGSSNENRNVMGPYLLHWSAMQIAKEYNCHIYDLLAVAPPDQPNHPYAGITRFKSQFGGQTVHLLGSFDLILHPFWYKLFSFIEKRRRHT